MTRDLIIVGAGGFGRETLDVVEAWNAAGAGEPFNVLGVIDDSPSESNLALLRGRGYPHLGGLNEMAHEYRNVQFLMCVGNPDVRVKLVEHCDEIGMVAASIIHPSASISRGAVIADGVIICGGVQVSTNVQIGSYVHLNPGAIIGHDTTIENNVSVNPGAIVSGDVTIESAVLIGAGATILQGLIIGEGAVVGAGSVVTRDVPNGVTVKGIPAK